MRSDSVSIERMIIHAVFGSSCEPVALRSSLTGLTSSFEPTIPPATRSEWPPMYLVSEYMTRSAPCSSGRWNTGPRNVLSTVTGGRGSPCSRPSHSEASRINRRSTRLLVGFAGVSVTISATRPPRSRASASACAAAVMTASLSQASDTGTPRIAKFGRVFSISVSVPP